jgi:hypothetical protein
MPRHFHWKLSALAIAFAIPAPTAQAALIEFTFGGELEAVMGNVPDPWSGIGPGTPFSVSYIFDSEAPDQDDSPAFGIYDALLSLTVTMDGTSLTTESGWIKVEFTGIPGYTTYFENLAIGTVASGAVSLSGFGVLESDALPTDIDLDQWTFGKIFEIAGLNDDLEFEAGGIIDTFSSRIVPAPGAGIILLVIPHLLGLPLRERKC